MKVVADALKALVKRLFPDHVPDSRHPERYNEDGSERKIRVRQGQTIRGTFHLDAPTGSDSRQVRRFKVRTAAFNELSRYNLPRSVRRKAAINARLEAK